MILSKLLSSLGQYQIFGLSDPTILRTEVTAIISDSRKAKKGDLFVAIKGLNIDAHNLIPEVISKGVSVIVGEKLPESKLLENITFIEVDNSRRALGLLASAWFDNPSSRLKIIGVTGTDGKTTTVNIIYHLLKLAGRKVGMISTVSAQIGDRIYDTGYHVTNPDQLVLQELLSQMVKDGCDHAVLEITSHGLDQERVAGIRFNLGVLTNITNEHLDYHKTYDNYLRTKAKLLLNSSLAIVNHDDSSYDQISGLLENKVEVESYDSSSLPEELRSVIEKTFPQKYNQLNATAAVTAVRKLGISDRKIMESIVSFPGVEGRMEEIVNDKGIKIIVDFAHTPNALKNVLEYLNSKKTGKLIIVFGSAGERDAEKRAEMGRFAGKYADILVITAEDPRTEAVNNIISQIEVGVKASGNSNYKTEPNRGKAISLAINNLAQAGDTVIIAGKGHEKSMCFGKVEYPWSDRKAVEYALGGKVLEVIR
jgi:UDP-N-acetylmuramoyl-L-alanyl-D-glutamate--2,6-diaminopimelate ligase